MSPKAFFCHLGVEDTPGAVSGSRREGKSQKRPLTERKIEVTLAYKLVELINNFVKLLLMLLSLFLGN
jgi:hypothetical protein